VASLSFNRATSDGSALSYAGIASQQPPLAAQRFERRISRQERNDARWDRAVADVPVQRHNPFVDSLQHRPIGLAPLPLHAEQTCAQRLVLDEGLAQSRACIRLRQVSAAPPRRGTGAATHSPATRLRTRRYSPTDPPPLSRQSSSGPASCSSRRPTPLESAGHRSRCERCQLLSGVQQRAHGVALSLPLVGVDLDFLQVRAESALRPAPANALASVSSSLASIP